MFPLLTTVAVRRPAMVTWTLIAINVAAFLFEISLSEADRQAFFMQYALVPARYWYPEWALEQGLEPASLAPFVTNTFLHGGWAHLILNMWTLYIFGPAVEDRMGPVRFVAFYMVAGFGASYAHGFINATSVLPALGASGAIAGILGAYLGLFPFSRILIMVLLIIFPLFFELPAIIYIGFWFMMQMVQGVADLFKTDFSGGVAWWAHIGGFIVGLAIVRAVCLPTSKYRRPQGDEGVLGFLPHGTRYKKGPWG